MTEHTKEATRNRAVLVGLNAHSLSREDNASETSLEELAALVETAGGECVGMLLQNRDAPEARTFIGEGKVREIRDLVQAMDANMAVAIAAIFSGSVFGTQLCFYSDNSILIGQATNILPLDHVRTQMPFALCAGVLAAAAYLIYGFAFL